MSVFLCAFGFIICFIMGRVSLAAGIGSVLTMGYLYGILRANCLDSLAHFIFDASVIGFYLSVLVGLPRGAKNPATKPLRNWMFALIGWALVMSMIPMQHYLIQIVGLRGNGFLLPFLLIGSWLSRDDADGVALWIAVLNHVAFAFAIAEFFVGVPAFFPKNAVTELIYNSADVGGSSAAGTTTLRIPSTFSNAHSYGGTMVIGLPWLLGLWVRQQRSTAKWFLLSSALIIAIIGIFMSAARTHVLLLGFLVLVTTFSGKLRGGFWLSWVVLLSGIGYIISSEERLQRFTNLQDTDAVAERIKGSINMHFFELLGSYPLGNGMGGGGTSIPFFLTRYVVNPIGMENEYCRILLEQGLPGLMLWLGFIGWILTRRPQEARDPWQFGKHLLWYVILAFFVTALTGIGLMTAIPQSTMLFLAVGFATTPVVLRKRAPAPALEKRAVRAAAAPVHA